MKAGGDVVAVHTGLCMPSLYAYDQQQQQQHAAVNSPTTSSGENVGGARSMLCHAWNGDRSIVAISPNSREV